MRGRGTVLGGRYVLVEQLGSGAMGAVWRAEDRVLGRQVAVKIVLPALLADAVFAARFRREARMLAVLNHRGVVDIHDYGEEESEPAGRLAFIVMELLDGRPLDQVRAEHGKLPAGQALDIVAQMLDALHAAHRQGIVHRDIKPSNLMLDDDGQVTVTDFGIARTMTGTRLTAADTVIGTALYLAPERAEGRDATPAADLYSVGVVCYELLIGEPPFTGETVLEVVLKHVREPVPPLPADLPEAVRALLTKALAKEPGDRFADAAAMAAEVRRAAQGAAPGAAGSTPTEAVVATFPTVRLGLSARGLPAVPDVPGPPATPTPAPATPAGPAPAHAPTPALTTVPTPEQAAAWAAAWAATNPGQQPPNRRRRTVMAVVLPVVVVAGTVTAVQLEVVPWQHRAGGADARATAAAPLSPGPSQSAGATLSGSVVPPASASASVPAEAATPAPGAPPVGDAGGAAGGAAAGGTAAGSGSGAGTGTGSAGGGSASGSSAGAGSATGTGSSSGTTGARSTPTPPSSGPTTPSECTGTHWGAITNVGDGLKLGLGADSPSGGVAVVMGGYTQYGWVRESSSPPYVDIHPCNASHPLIGGQIGASPMVVEVAGGYGTAAAWALADAGNGTYYIKFAYGPDACLTDNGSGRQLSVASCVPGSKTQIWRLP